MYDENERSQETIISYIEDAGKNSKASTEDFILKDGKKVLLWLRPWKLDGLGAHDDGWLMVDLSMPDDR